MTARTGNNHEIEATQSQDWYVTAPDGTRVPWKGFSTGPRVLTDSELQDLAMRLLGLHVDDIEAACSQELSCFFAESDSPRPSHLILQAATSSTHGFEGDLDDLIRGRRPWDVPSYLETRAIYLATEADLVVCRLPAAIEAAELRSTPYVNLARSDYYYLSHVLLLAADENPHLLRGILDFFKAQPDAVVSVYALDLEMQIFLLWLKRTCRLQQLNILANNSRVSSFWNAKAPLHPTITEALLSMPESENCDEKREFELSFSALRKHLGIRVPALPGYTISRIDSSEPAFVQGVLDAAHLLQDRYLISTGCLKPSQAGDGARIEGPLQLGDEDLLIRLAKEAYSHGDDYILEAFVTYDTIRLENRDFILAPSAHVQAGQISDGVTLQFINGRSWQGNVLISRESSDALGVSVAMFDEIMQTMENLVHGFLTAESQQDGSYRGLVTAGVDFAVGRIDGPLGHHSRVFVTDLNLSSHGAEYLRSFVANHTPRQAYAASWVFRPTVNSTTKVLHQILAGHTSFRSTADVVAAIPERWGMIVCGGSSPAEAAKNVFDLFTYLISSNLAQKG